jgi:hypothetical protein
VAAVAALADENFAPAQAAAERSETLDLDLPADEGWTDRQIQRTIRSAVVPRDRGVGEGPRGLPKRAWAFPLSAGHFLLEPTRVRHGHGTSLFR